MKHRTSDELKIQRRKFRAKPTNTERILWNHLRNRQLDGFKFRRQHPVAGRFILDFYCAERKLAVEVDGGIHLTTQEIDKEREEYISFYGIRFIRFSNKEVENKIDWVLEKLLEELNG